jgi:hypothetical protein
MSHNRSILIFAHLYEDILLGFLGKKSWLTIVLVAASVDALIYVFFYWFYKLHFSKIGIKKPEGIGIAIIKELGLYVEK